MNSSGNVVIKAPACQYTVFKVSARQQHSETLFSLDELGDENVTGCCEGKIHYDTHHTHSSVGWWVEANSLQSWPSCTGCDASQTDIAKVW